MGKQTNKQSQVQWCEEAKQRALPRVKTQVEKGLEIQHKSMKNTAHHAESGWFPGENWGENQMAEQRKDKIERVRFLQPYTTQGWGHELPDGGIRCKSTEVDHT